jgi:hypothetical protein
MTAKRNDAWSDDQIATLKDMWRTNTGAEIGVALGKTRSAVLGMVNRMDLPKKSDTLPRKKAQRPPRLRVAPKPPEPAPEPYRGPIPLLEAGFNDCRAIIGSTDGPYGLATVCGKRIVDGANFSFCAEHLEIFVQKQRG